MYFFKCFAPKLFVTALESLSFKWLAVDSWCLSIYPVMVKCVFN